MLPAASALEATVEHHRPPITASLALVAVTSLAACENPVETVGTVRAPGEMQLATFPGDLTPDLGMAQIDDITIRTVGGRRLLAFSTTIVNVGAGPFELHGRRSSTSEENMTVVIQRIFDASGNWRDETTDAVMEYGGDGHDHWHVHDLQRMELIRLDNGVKVGTGAKRGFCFWDNAAYRLSLPGAPSSPVYGSDGCGDTSSLETETGLSVGWGDLYPFWLPDQNIDITGQTAGRFRLIVTADPLGWFTEADESNNTTWVDLQVQANGKRVRVLGYGPEA